MAELVPLASFDVDLQAEYAWREERHPGAGDKFHAELERDVSQLERFPRSGSAIKRSGLRRLLVCGGRFAVIHAVELRGIMLHALLDLRADPAFNARRIREITRRLSQP